MCDHASGGETGMNQTSVISSEWDICDTVQSARATQPQQELERLSLILGTKLPLELPQLAKNAVERLVHFAHDSDAASSVLGVLDCPTQRCESLIASCAGAFVSSLAG